MQEVSWMKQPFLFRNGITAHGRLVVPAMASATATAEGMATEKTIEHYKNLAESGASIVIVEYTFVHPSGRAEPAQLGIATDVQGSSLVPVAQAIRSQGAIAGIQLVHAGGKTEKTLTQGRLLAPSSIAIPVKGREMEIPEAMSLSDIADWKKWFVEAALRAAAAGFDLVEIHAAHGYGLSQWLSPLTNRRDDVYGGDGRFQLLFEIVEAVRAAIPRLLVSVRFPGRDFQEGGFELSDAILVGQGLEVRGVDIVSVSSGLGGWRNPTSRASEGYLVEEARHIQREIQIPVIGVGGIKSESYINNSIAKGYFQFAAVGRAILHKQFSFER